MLNRGWTYREKVDRATDGLTLLAYYAEKYRHSSIEEWRERIRSGQVLINGNQANPEDIVRIGQGLTYDRPPWQEPDVPLSFEVLYEDRDILVVAKPSGLPVLAGGGFLEHTLIHQIQTSYPEETPFPIHRLGRGTSGIVLMARSRPSRANLSQQMRERQIRKVYRALVGGGQMSDRFTIIQAIGKIPHPLLGDVYGASPQGLSARSDCRVLQRTSQTTLLEVEILTGRPHQIRIHLAFAGYPLLGDPLYEAGGRPRPAAVPGDCGYHLHAYRISFQHPSTGKEMDFVCLAPVELSVESLDHH
jgi:23S rRNA pseudouridine1911/1915/1917 synthase